MVFWLDCTVYVSNRWGKVINILPIITRHRRKRVSGNICYCADLWPIDWIALTSPATIAASALNRLMDRSPNVAGACTYLDVGIRIMQEQLSRCTRATTTQKWDLSSRVLIFCRQRKTPLHVCRGVILNRCLAITVTVPLSSLLAGLHWLRQRLARESSQYHAGHCQTQSKKGQVFRLGPFSEWVSGNDLLSHGEAPHYHRR